MKNVNRTFFNLLSFKNVYIKFKYLTNNKYQSNNLLHRIFHFISFHSLLLKHQSGVNTDHLLKNEP